MRIRLITVAVTTVTCLAVASVASADPINAFTAAAAPSLVRPSTSGTHTISLTSDPSSPNRAQRATIGIPPGFTVDAGTVSATTTAAAGLCDAATWEADGELIVDQTIQLRRPGGDSNALCPGATLTIVFVATSAPADGTYAWTTQLFHGAGEAFTLTGQHPSVVVDGTAPVAAIAQKPSNPSNAASAGFTFTANEPASFECKLDAGVFEACTPPESYTGLADGAHTFAVKATDAAGNTGPEASYSWTVDTTPPTISLGERPTNPSNDASPSIAFSAGEPSTFECKLDAGAFAPCSSPKGYGSVADGAHTFQVRPTDAAGNTGAAASYQWTIDTAAPTVAITRKPANPSNSTSARFDFAPNEAATVVCRLDAAPFAACESPMRYSALSDGAHTFVVKATDPAGNAGPETSHTWTIDTSAPVAAITSKPATPTNNAAATFAFTADGPAAFLCKLDAAPFAPCTSPKSYASVPDGAHTFVVKAIDAAGNTGPEATYSWTVDTTPPSATITTKPSNPSNTSFPSFGFMAGEAGVSFVCKLDGAAFAPCTSPKTYTNLAEISHTFVVKATDAAGNTGPETSYTWTIDTTPPIASITGHPDNPSNQRAPTFAFTANEGGSTFSCKLDGAAFGPCTSPKGYANLADGVHTFTVRATDAAGNVGASLSYGWTIDTTAPIVAITQKPSDPTRNRTATFAFSAGDATAFQCSLDGAGFTACSSPKTYTDLSEGSHTFAVRATDALGNAGLVTSDAWTIDTTAPTAAILLKPGSPSNDSSPSFAFVASETGSSFACRLEGGGFAPCSSPKDYSGLADGQHSFGVRATDPAGNTGPEASFVWTVDTVAPTATITVKPSNPSNSASPSFSFTASEPGSTSLCSLDGSAFSPCSSPTVYTSLGDGPHTFGVKAVDPAGNTGTETSFGWTIETRAPTAALTSAPSGLSNSSVATFAFSADEPSTFECSIDGRGFESCSSPVTQHGLGDGGHAFTVRAKDAVGNLSAPVDHSWTIDTTAPETTLAAAPSSGTSTSATFAFTATESGMYECRLDGAPFAVCGSPKDYSGLGSGEHRFEVRAVDAAGNADPTPAGHVWRIEAPAPVRATSSSALLAPQAGARVSRPPLLVWRRAARASYYNVQLFRGRQKILSVWPSRARLQLRVRWRFGGRMQRLTPGAYRWYVWPGFGAPAARNYGSVLGQSSFVVVRARARR